MGLSSDEIRRAATEQRAYWRKTSKQTERAVASVRDLVEHTDRNLNGDVLPELGAAIRTVHTDVGILTGSANETLLTASEALGAVRDQASNPDVTASVANAAVATKQLADAATNVNKATEDLAAAVHRATKPASLAKQLLKNSLDVASKLRILIP